MQNIIQDILTASIAVKKRFVGQNTDLILQGAKKLADCISAGHKILLFGNGGSAADAQHIAAEFVNRFQIERPPLAAMALTTDTSVITSIGNDYHFDEIFAKQIKALGRPQDVAVGISTSGNSPNVIKAMEAAKQIGMASMGFSGPGGKLAGCADIIFRVESDTTARIQETHIILGHMLCDLVDRMLYPDAFGPPSE